MPEDHIGAENTPEVVTLVCTLRFLDGKTVTARIKALSPSEESAVVYAGAVERLPVLCQRADSVMLRVLFQSCARELRAVFAMELIGTWTQNNPNLEDRQG